MPLQRRSFLGAAGLLATPRVLFARALTERRFIFIIQRGAADGLHTVVPYADPAYARHRGALVVDATSALKLDGSFALHPALGELFRLYQHGEANFFHAVASPYRERSHFDGQNVLESGGTAPYQLRDGWLNRLAALLTLPGKAAIAFSPAIPMAMRGTLEVATYAPSALPPANDDLMMRVAQLYAGDAQLNPIWNSALETRGMAGGSRAAAGRSDSAAMGRMAASFLARQDGPRLAMIETEGWDTHSAQAGRLALRLQALDSLIAGLREGMGPAWSETVVLVATEFGRTVAVNGTGGTDHGTGSAAMLVGGAVRGGRMIADWPGLAAANLFEGRDLRPTLSLDALIAQTCAETFQMDPDRVAQVLSPGHPRRAPLPGLLRS